MINIGAILILLRPEMKSTFHHTLIALAIVDILFLVTLIIDSQVTMLKCYIFPTPAPLPPMLYNNFFGCTGPNFGPTNTNHRCVTKSRKPNSKFLFQTPNLKSQYNPLVTFDTLIIN